MKIRNFAGDKLTSSDVRASLLTGVIGGCFMMLVLMFFTLAVGFGFLYPLKTIAALFVGESALYGALGVAALGLGVHLVVSALFGFFFSFFIQHNTPGGVAFFEGIIYGVVVWAAMTFFVLPVANPVMSLRLAMMPGTWLFVHLLFGIFMTLAPTLERKFEVRLVPLKKH